MPDIQLIITDDQVPQVTVSVPGIQGAAGAGFPGGGTTNQVLAKSSNTAYDTTWKTLSKADVGLSSVENTALSTWVGSTSITTLGTISTGTVPAANVSGLAASATTNALNASNISSGTLNASRLPSVNIGTTVVDLGRESGALALNGVSIDGSAGSVDWADVSGKPTAVSGFTNDANYITSAEAPVQSVAGRTGDVTLAKADVGLSNVENTALSTWAGSTNITTLGTISTGTVPAANVSGLAASATTNALNASNISSGTLAISRGGTGVTGTPSNGQLLIGNGTGYTLATLTQGSNISITNNAGSITIAATGGSAETVSPLLLMGA